MKKRKGLTLIELLIVFCFLAILVSLILPLFFTFSNQKFIGKVTEKWTDVDFDNTRIYRIRTVSQNEEVDTWDSRWIHGKVVVNKYYEFQVGYGAILKDAVECYPVQDKDN